MPVFKDKYGRPVTFTDERLKHIESGHPEMIGQLDRIEETLKYPETIVRSRSDKDAELFCRFYSTTPVTRKYLCVVVKVLPGNAFIITAYYTDTVKKGELLWKKR